MAFPKVNPLAVGICQRMAYRWFLECIGEDSLKGMRVLDFGPNGYPLSAFLAQQGAEVSWVDRDPAVAEKMVALEARYGVELREVRLPVIGPQDIVIASNAIQHNREGALELYGALWWLILERKGRLYICEALTSKTAYWDDKRPDPCWVRPLADHEALWKDANLSCRTKAFFKYRSAKTRGDEKGAWVPASEANRVVAELEASS